MFEIMVEDYFSAAHRLREYKGKCEELHGHNWKVEVSVEGRSLNPTGMVLDFKELKDKLKNVLQKLDHRYLNEVAPFDKINPTSENVACYIYGELKKNLNDAGIKLSKVTVWEAEKSGATYMEG